MTNSPLNPTMLLWINIVMDLLAALSLATEPPQASIIHQKAITDEEIILNKVIWRQIYAIMIWEFFVMFIIIYFGEAMFDLRYTAGTQVENRGESYESGYGLNVPTIVGLEAQDKAIHMTIIFNTFVFLQWWNMINCRTVEVKDFNVFRRFFGNWMFIAVLVLIFLVQWSASNYWFGIFLFETTEISSQDFFTSFVWGFTVLPIAWLVKMTPVSWVEKLPVKIDENKAIGENSKLMNAYQKNAKGKVVAPKTNQVDDDAHSSLNEDSDDHYRQV